MRRELRASCSCELCVEQSARVLLVRRLSARVYVLPLRLVCVSANRNLFIFGRGRWSAIAVNK